MQYSRTTFSVYTGEHIVLATKHSKERAIAPVFAETLGAQIIAPAGIDTDILGTFTGEIPRAGTVMDAVLSKARMGMMRAGLPVGLASEGSYGPHPQIPFIPAGHEVIAFLDEERRLTITEQMLDDGPTYAHAVVGEIQSAEDFLARVGFPAQGLIVKPNKESGKEQNIAKGIQSFPELDKAIGRCAASSLDGQAFVQTDMRAHMNPRRMETIGKLAEKLARRLLTHCPRCSAPGFGTVRVEPGLPCSWCGTPTDLVRFVVRGCAACTYEEKHSRDDGEPYADPGQCEVCNP